MPGVISKHHPWRCALLKNIKKYINLVVSADTEETYTLVYVGRELVPEKPLHRSFQI